MRIERDEAQQPVKQAAWLVDVLPREECDDEHLPEAITIPLKDLDRATVTRLPRNWPVIVYCNDSQ